MNIEDQETLDYNNTVAILRASLKDKLIDTTRLPQKSHVDMKFKALSKSKNILEYGMEIKSVRGDCYKNLGLIFKVAKYINVRNWSKINNERVYLIYLCIDTNEYYIFDTNKIKLDEVVLENMLAKAVQYDPDSPRCQQPVIKLFEDTALLKGTINPHSYTLLTGGNNQEVVN